LAAEATVKIGSSLKLNNLGKFRLPKHFVGELKINSDTDAIIKMYKNSNQWGKNNYILGMFSFLVLCFDFLLQFADLEKIPMIEIILHDFCR